MMPKNSEYNRTKFPAVNTKQTNFQMPAGAPPFGGFNNGRNVNNRVMGGINGNLIGRVVRDEKQDDTKIDEKKIDQPSIVDNTTDASVTTNSKMSEKNYKNDEASYLKDIIELEKLKLLKDIGKEKKQDNKENNNESRFENDYPDIYQNRGNRVFDTIGTQWFINSDATKQQELVKQINWLLSPTSDYVKNYNEREKQLESDYDKAREKHEKDYGAEGKKLKDGIKSVNFALIDDLENIVNSFMKRVSCGKIDGKNQLTLSKADLYDMAQEIADLANKLTKEANDRTASNGMKLDQSSVNERKKMALMLNNLLYKFDLLDVSDVRHAIEEDCERVSKIYNGLNIFQRFWYALMDLIFGTNYNQEYSDIIAIQRLMIREIDLSNDELNSKKHYKHILTFCDLSNKLDNVRENMATYLLYPDKKADETIRNFKQEALKPKRSADDIFIGLFEICGGKMLSQYVPVAKKDKKRQYMKSLLIDSAQIKGVNPTVSQRKEIIDLALSGKNGEEINNEMELIAEDDEEKKSKIDDLNCSVSSGSIGSLSTIFTKKAMKDKGDVWQAKSFGSRCLIEQKYVKDQIGSFDQLFHETSSFLNQVVSGSLTNLINNAMLEDESGISKGSYQMAKMEPFIIGSIKSAYNRLLQYANKFDINDKEDKVYDDAVKHITKEMQKISSEKLSEKDKKEGKKPSTELGHLQQDKFEEIYIFKELLSKIKSPNEMNKEYYNKIKEAIIESREQLVNNIKEIFSQFKQKANLINAWQAHKENDKEHLYIHRDIENQKSKLGARFYNELLKVLTNKQRRGGFPGMGDF